jgi:Fe-S-cluster containining protein
MPDTAYASLLTRLDQWFATGRVASDGVVPCRGGCSACCHGPFDISVADAELLQAAVAQLPVTEREDVERRAAALLDRMLAIEPEWRAPHAVEDLGDARFDRLAEQLADEPCPLLDDSGRCRVYASRPLVCRLIGLPMDAGPRRIIENACPIQDRFPAYAELAPVPFELEVCEAEEAGCLRAAAGRRFANETQAGFETTIAAALTRSPSTTGRTAHRWPGTSTGSRAPT